MKTKILPILMLVSGLVSAQYDPFSGTGALNANGWSTFGGTSGEINILTTPSGSGNSLAYTGLTSQGNRVAFSTSYTEDLDKAFTAPITTTAYVSFLLKVTDASTFSANSLATPPGYAMFFSPNSGTNIGSTGWVSRLSFRQGSNSQKFNMGVLNTTGGSAGLTDVYGSTTPAEYNVGQTYFVVIKYDMTGSTGNTKLWVNPAIAATEGTPVVSSSFGSSAKLAQVASFGVRTANNTGNFELDEVRLGSTWSEVVPTTTLGVADAAANSKNVISNTLVKDNFKILLSGKNALEIYAPNGSLVSKKMVIGGDFVDISQLNPGMYLLKITNGTEVRTVKIIKL